MRKRNKFYIYFFVAALLLQFIVVLKKIMDPPATVELTLYDESFTVGETVLIEYITLFYFLSGLGYWILKKRKRKMNNTLSIIHTMVTVGSLLLYLLVIPVSSLFEEDFYDGFKHNNKLIMILLPPLAVALLLYLINIIIGIQTPYRRHNRRKAEY